MTDMRTHRISTISRRRVLAMVRRYWYLLRGSWPRIVELMYWPTIQMIMWGFITMHLRDSSTWVAQAAGVLLTGVLLWDILFRGQLGYTLSFLEEMYSRIEDVNVAVLQLANLEMSPRMERMLVGCLCNLSCPKNNQGRLVEEGCVRVIARIIDALQPTPEAKPEGRALDTLRLCAKTLSNLSGCSRSRSKMTGQRVIPVLLKMAATDDEEMKQECAMAITRLAICLVLHPVLLLVFEVAQLATLSRVAKSIFILRQSALPAVACSR